MLDSRSELDLLNRARVSRGIPVYFCGFSFESTSKYI